MTSEQLAELSKSLELSMVAMRMAEDYIAFLEKRVKSLEKALDEARATSN